MRKSVAMIPLVLGFVLALAGPAQAALITFEFGGQVTSISDSSNFLQGRIVVGQSYSARYTFDSETPDMYPNDPRGGGYPCIDNSFQMIFGGLVVDVPRTRLG